MKPVIVSETEAYNVATEWHEIPTEKLSALVDLVKNTPKIGTLDYLKWQVKLCKIITNENRIHNLKPEQLELLLSVFYSPLENSGPKFDSFTFKEVQYLCPLSRTTSDGIFVPMSELTIGEQIDALSLIENQKQEDIYKRLPNLLAILYRENGKEYDENEVAKRAELFKTLPPITAITSYFFLLKRWISLLSDTELSGLKQISRSANRSMAI